MNLANWCRNYWIFVFLWILLGWFLSPRIYTDTLLQSEKMPQYEEMRVKEITSAYMGNDENLLICFKGLLGKEEQIYSLVLDVPAMKSVPGVTLEKTAQELGRNVFKIHYENVRQGCPDRKHGASVRFGMLDREDASTWGDFARLRPPDENNLMVYGVDQKWQETLILIVGDFANKKNYIALRFMQKPLPKLKHPIFLKTFALIVDTLFFPIEWFLFLSFKG